MGGKNPLPCPDWTELNRSLFCQEIQDCLEQEIQQKCLSIQFVGNSDLKSPRSDCKQTKKRTNFGCDWEKSSEEIRSFLLQSSDVGDCGDTTTAHEVTVQYGGVYHCCVRYKCTEDILDELNSKIVIDRKDCKDDEYDDLKRQLAARRKKFKAILNNEGKSASPNYC
jgi:hypothetical protein